MCSLPSWSNRVALTMPLHLIKLCVGCDSVADLEDWIRRRVRERRKRGAKGEHIHTTRMVPKRADELLDGGSLYWVIRGQIMCREQIRDIRPFVDKDGIGRCRLALGPKVVLVEPRPWRAFPAPATCRKSCVENCANWGCCDRRLAGFWRLPAFTRRYCQSGGCAQAWQRPTGGPGRLAAT